MLPVICLSQPLISNPAVTVGYGRSYNKSDVYKASFKGEIPKISDSKIGYLGGYLEISTNYWSGNEKIFVFALSPIFTYSFDFSKWDKWPYIEAGIGFSHLSSTYINDRTLSSHFQFEDRVGIGFRTKKFDYNFRYLHYSNANFKTPNEGMEIFIFSLGYYL